eukprot:3418185-Rhodomonas_salina.4
MGLVGAKAIAHVMVGSLPLHCAMPGPVMVLPSLSTVRCSVLTHVSVDSLPMYTTSMPGTDGGCGGVPGGTAEREELAHGMHSALCLRTRSAIPDTAYARVALSPMLPIYTVYPISETH